MHVLTHALLAAIIFFLYKDVRNASILPKIILALIGGFAGIIPDLFGSRNTSLWTHSIISAPLLVLPVVFITKIIYRKLVWWKIWIALASATIIGHIFIDFLTHEVSIIYPFTEKQYASIIFEAGDPWVWFPLLITLILLVFSSKKSLVSITIALSLVVSYFAIRTYSKYELESRLEDYYGEVNEIIAVTPPAEILINIKNPLDYLKWSYDLVSEQRAIRGFSPLFGDALQTHTNTFYPEPRVVKVDATGPYSSGDDFGFNVVMDVKLEGKYYLVSERINDDNLKVFRQEVDGRWIEILGTEKQVVMEQYEKSEEK